VTFLTILSLAAVVKPQPVQWPLQESAKYAHSLFQNTVMLYGRTMRVDYSPQGNPEAKSTSYVTAKGDLPKAAAPLGAVAAAGGGFILKRKNRNVDMTLPAPIQP
jgi:hypothetical protein